MNHYVIAYDSRKGAKLVFEAFGPASGAEALRRRFALEAIYAGNPDVEVVILGGPDEAALRVTHARYFADLEELVKAATLVS
jgi:hypothetical protein